jgi:hypothetical protein
VAVLADLQAANPEVHSAGQYVRIVRHQFEKDGMVIEKPESEVEVSGVPFMYAILKVSDGAGGHYRGIYSTFLDGYILSIDVSAATPEKIAELVQREVKFEAKPK